jgi:PAS domain S-box-containing protein
LFPDAVGREEAWLAERIAARHVPKGPVERRRQDGRWLIVDDQKLPDGGIVSFGVEITDRKRAEAEAEAARRQLGLALEFARAAVWDFNLVDDVVTIGEGWAELATGPGGESRISRRALVDMIHPDDQARTISTFVETLKGASADYSAEYRMLTPAGRWLWILSRGQVSRRDAAGRALRMVGINIDITERKRAEEDVRQARRKLQLALDFSKVLLWDYDLAGDTISFSEGRQELMAGSTANRPFSRRELAEAIHPDDLDEALSAYLAALKGTAPQYVAEYRLRTHDGAWLWVHSRGQVSERTPAGQALRMIGVNIDISERKVAEEALRTLNAELERRIAERTAALETAYRELESFSYSVSHDLRAPLRSISGYAGLLREDEGERLSEDGRGYIAIIDESARHMGRLIDALLSLAQTSRQTLGREPVDLGRLARFVVDQLGREHPGALVSVGALPAVEGDPTLLRQVMSNLIGNALKYSARSDPSRVEIGALSEGNDTTFFVRDNGVGFDMAYADKLFQAFGRLHTDAEFQGTGIGLVLTKLIVERHGGRIWAESRPGAGAQFNFTLGPPKTPA